MCKRKNCSAHLHLRYVDRQVKVRSATPHKCVTYSKTSKTKLREYLRTKGLQSKLTKLFMQETRRELGDPYITDQRIRRAYQRVHAINLPSRLQSWSLLPSLCDLVVASGGTATMVTNDDGNCTFCGIMPEFCHRYVQSSLFFGVVSLDGSFQCGLGRGTLLAIVTLTGERTILPLSWAWAAHENSENIKTLVRLMKPEEVEKIQTVISDEGKAITGTIKDLLGDSHIALCAKHKDTHLDSSGLFWKMLKSTTPAEYARCKQEYMEEDPDEFEKIRLVLPYLTRWERDLPRDLLLTNGIAESFNAMCVNFRGMEPLALLRNIYALARAQIIELRRQDTTRTYTKAAFEYLSQAAQLASRLTCSEVGADETVTVSDTYRDFQVDLQLGTCSCQNHRECGLPCVHMLCCCSRRKANYQDYIHPRYLTSEISAVFPEIPPSIDFTALTPRAPEPVRPPVLYSLKTKKKRGLGILDMKAVDAERKRKAEKAAEKQRLKKQGKIQRSLREGKERKSKRTFSKAFIHDINLQFTMGLGILTNLNYS